VVFEPSHGHFDTDDDESYREERCLEKPMPAHARGGANGSFLTEIERKVGYRPTFGAALAHSIDCGCGARKLRECLGWLDRGRGVSQALQRSAGSAPGRPR